MKALILTERVYDIVEDGKEFPVSSEMEWVDCDSTVKNGYLYKDNKFTKPTPTQTPEQALRKQRNSMLSQSDWEMLKGLETNADVTGLKKYRQDLRDLPANSSPELDDNDALTNVTWPTKPN
jgi:hypothetical protein